MELTLIGYKAFKQNHMKRSTLITLFCLLAFSLASEAKDGYKIHLKLSNAKTDVVYLCHYYGKPGPTIYKRDSAKLRNGVAEFNSVDPAFVGGIFIMLFTDTAAKKSYNFDFLLNKGDDMIITADVNKLPDDVKFKNTPENERFTEYVAYLKKYGERQKAIEKEYNEAKTTADTAAARKKAVAASKELNKYREDYAAKYPGSLLANIFMAMKTPEVPEGDHFLEDGKTKDSTFAYKYYKAHFWDGFNFQDDRLIYTPIYDSKIEEYITKEVLQYPDSLEHEADMLVKKTRGTKDMFKYTLWWLTRNVENSKVMGIDEVFVYLVENYYMKGDAFWLSDTDLKKYTDRVQKIAPNVIGNVAPEVKVQNVMTGKKGESLHGIKANYTLLVFYSPDCGHCQHEIPLLDSAYEASLKDKGVKIMTVATEGEEQKIKDFITKHKLEKWTNCWDPEHLGDWRGKYDVYSTPTIYLMDDRKIIRGKRLDHSNIGSVIEMTERKKAKKKD